MNINSNWDFFLQLVKKEYEFNQEKKILSESDQSQLLINRLKLENNFFYEKKQSFIDLIQFFLKDPTPEKAEGFSNMFQTLYESESRNFQNLLFEAVVKKDKKKLEKVKLLFEAVNVKASRFSVILAEIYGHCDAYSPVASENGFDIDNFINEKELEKCIKKAFDKILASEES